MADNPIPDDVLEFIDRHVTSIDLLEILLLLRTHGERTWSAAEVSRELRSNEQAAGDRLNALRSAGLVEPVAGAEPKYRYAPESSRLDLLVSRVEQCYRDYRLRVIERVFTKPDELRSFAEAFRIRKEHS